MRHRTLDLRVLTEERVCTVREECHSREEIWECLIREVVEERRRINLIAVRGLVIILVGPVMIRRRIISPVEIHQG